MNNEYQNNYQEYPQNSNNNEDKGSFGFAILGFIFPIIGLILYIIWKDKKPASSKKAGIGALIGFILNIISLFLLPTLMWGAIQDSLIDQSCRTTFGEGYNGVKKGVNYYCQDETTGELIKID